MSQSETKLFQARLTEAEKRRIKTLAASQGLTLREAILQAFEAWEEKLQPLGLPAHPARGTPAGTDLRKPDQPKRAATRRQGLRPAEEASAVTPGGGHVADQEDTSRDWLRRAAQVNLDWSKCPAAERLLGKSGDVWVARGTRVPLVGILDAVAEGESFVDITEVFQISLQQLIAILQFAAQHVAK
jgi:hypothetical protein